MTNKQFAWSPRHFPSLAHFRAFLATRARPSWINGLTIHHTVSPLPRQWQGRVTMDRLGVYYRDQVQNRDGSRGWSAGPHAFICVGAPNAAHDGIWIGTPFDQPGVHAGTLNNDHLGFEIVGNYDRTPWPTNLAALVEGAAALTLHWLNLPVSAVNGHRDDPTTTKSCPGHAIDLAVVRANIAARLLPTRRMRVIAGIDYAAVRQSPDIKGIEAGRLMPGEIVLIDEVQGRWAHISRNDPRRDLGFIHSSLLENAPA